MHLCYALSLSIRKLIIELGSGSQHSVLNFGPRLWAVLLVQGPGRSPRPDPYQNL